MKQKKLMLLGGIRYLLPVIKAAHELGVHVITADYLPDNIAHKYSNEYVNVFILDRDTAFAVPAIAHEKHIDCIFSILIDRSRSQTVTLNWKSQIVTSNFVLKSIDLILERTAA